jgi:hypothetical protein
MNTITGQGRSDQASPACLWNQPVERATRYPKTTLVLRDLNGSLDSDRLGPATVHAWLWQR